jgi:hypothetical protein
MEEMEEAAPRRGRGSGTGRTNREAASREDYDLLIAMALGAAVGAGITLLVRRGPEGRSPAYTAAHAARRGAVKAGRYGAKGARKVRRRGAEMIDNLPFEEIGESLGSYLESARESIDDAVARELKSLRKAVRRQRKRLGV